MEDKFENLGQEIDRIENLWYGLSLPMPAEFHLQQLKVILPEIVKNLKNQFVAISGENPWE